MGHKASLDIQNRKKKTFAPAEILIPDRPARSPVTIRTYAKMKGRKGKKHRPTQEWSYQVCGEVLV